MSTGVGTRQISIKKLLTSKWYSISILTKRKMFQSSRDKRCPFYLSSFSVLPSSVIALEVRVSFLRHFSFTSKTVHTYSQMRLCCTHSDHQLDHIQTSAREWKGRSTFKVEPKPTEKCQKPMHSILENKLLSWDQSQKISENDDPNWSSNQYETKQTITSTELHD